MAESVVVTIGEQEYELLVNDILGVADPAKKLAELGVLLAEAEAEKILADGLYRQWRAKKGNEIRRSVKGLAEWRVKQKTEATDTFLNFKRAEAACERNVTILRNLICGLLAKTGVTDPNSHGLKEG